MELREQQELRLASLQNAYMQLINVLNKKLDLSEVDPEKLGVSLKAYKMAADDSAAVFLQIKALKQELDK